MYPIDTDPLANVLVVLSGGQDSTTCLYAALTTRAEVDRCDMEAPKVIAIAFDYGQKHLVELQCAKKIAEDAGVELTVVPLPFYKNLVKSALTDTSLSTDSEHHRLKGRPATFTPNRNALFLTLAHAYAQEQGCQEIWTGVCETDFSGYPDCRINFICKMFDALNEGAESEIDVVTPLMYLTKAQTFQLAADAGGLQAVLHDSHTCYNGDHSTANTWGYGCGTCPACDLRAKGWAGYLAYHAGD